MRRFVLLVVACCVAATISAPGLAGAAETHTNCITFDGGGNVIGLTPNCSQTVSQQGGVPPQSKPVVNPCTGDTGIVTLLVTHQIYHINVDGAGDGWDTGTMNTSVSFVPDDSSKPSGSGSSTAWFGDSFNAQNTVQTFTARVAVHFSNGQTAIMHEVGHFALTPGGATFTFDKASGWVCN